MCRKFRQLCVELNDISRMHETANCGVRFQKRKQKKTKTDKNVVGITNMDKTQ